jgi:hypothetical protein
MVVSSGWGGVPVVSLAPPLKWYASAVSKVCAVQLVVGDAE